MNLSKLLILAILSCVLLLAKDYTASDFIGTGTADIEDSVSAKPSSQSIWASMSRDLTLDHEVQSERVQREIRRLVADPDHFNKVLEAAAPYIYFIYNQTHVYGLPTEIALIPVIESEFNPNDRSKAGATGLWQLMPQTARELGVKVKSGYDGRRNVVASTQAALAYFKDLGNMFNSNWPLAIAAYNCGQNKVSSAMRRQGSQSFWNLPLPQETKYYVPRLLAVAEIVKHPEKYGVKLPQVNNQPYFTEMNTKSPANIEHVATTLNVDVKTMKALNPDYNHQPVPTKGAAYTLLVPANKATMATAQLADKATKTS